MKVLILGAGAVGGYFGGRLAQLASADCDVTFLVRAGRQEQLQTHGLQIEDFNGEHTTLHVQTVTADSTVQEPFDVIVLTCKAYSLESALDSISGFVHDDVVILPLLNGMAHMEAIGQRFPKAILWGGTCGVAATLTPDGMVKKMTEMQFLSAGVRSSENNQKGEILSKLIQFMQQAGINASENPTIMTKMWEKWTFLATVGAATCLLDGGVGEILSTDYGQHYIHGVYQECNQVATASLGGVELDKEPQIQATYKRLFGDKTSKFRSSMARDLQNGYHTEGDHILGDLIRRAKEYNIATPFLSIAYTRLQIYEAQRANKQ